MPQFIEFKIVSTRLMAMSADERHAYLNKIRTDAETQDRSGVYVYKEAWNPFPAWLQDVIRAMASMNNSKARYDDENSVFRVKIAGERYEFDTFYKEFQKGLESVVAADPEHQKWSSENIVHLTASPDDELAAMNDLELYQRNSSAMPPSRTPQAGA